MKILNKYMVDDEKKKDFKSDKIMKEMQKLKNKFGGRFDSQEMAKNHIDYLIRKEYKNKPWWNEEDYLKIINQY
jgi:hypothetical protein